MWKACSSEVRFSIVQSSTAPTLVTIAGGSLALNNLGCCPSTVRKKFTGGFVPTAASEKYNFRCVVGFIWAKPEKRWVTGGTGAAGTTVRAACTALAVGTTSARTWKGFALPTGPVLKPASTKVAVVPVGGPVTMNAARPAGGTSMVVTIGSPVTGTPSNEINSMVCAVLPNNNCKARNACVDALATRQNCFSPGFI